MREQDRLRAAALAGGLAIAFGGWSTWVFLMAYWGSPFDWPLLRALVRIAVLLVPAIFILRWTERERVVAAMGFARKPVRAVLVGVAVGLALTVPIFWGDVRFAPPRDLAVWVNAIVGSPVAEEFLFRGVVFGMLALRIDWRAAMGVSALLFAAFHLPAWLVLEQRSMFEVWLGFVQMFVYGLLFAMLYQGTRSIWAPIAAHVVNNFIVAAT